MKPRSTTPKRTKKTERTQLGEKQEPRAVAADSEPPASARPLRERPSAAAPALPRSAAPEPHGDDEPNVAAGKPLCVVGVGASAGGLEALSALFSKLPADTGMAFVLVPHLSPDEPSLLAELLGKTTSMAVREATHEVLLERNHVYVMPPSTTMTHADGRLLLAARTPRGQNMPIDGFLRSLALSQHSRAVAVILSGTGSDGALGVQAIKAAAGITFAQDAQSARFDGMPLSAMATGCVDFMLPPEQIATEIGALAGRLRAAYGKAIGPDLEPESDEDLKRVFAILRAAHGVDFTPYRHTTIKRRILRRMILTRVATLGDYVALLRERPVEVEALYHDILIKVTHFFRDPEAFEVLQKQIFPALIQARPGDTPIRIWVPGCSTGEEPYSLAIALLEVIAEQGVQVPFQIFATDVSEAALETARNGAYIENIAMDVSPERLRRFFTKAGKLYQINKSIRDCCVFARQNLTRDPPFSRLDLISCRNVLIYLDPVLQKRVIPVFHYALKPGGYLVLGTSETVGGLSELFTIVDKKNKIYTKGASPARHAFEFPGGARALLERGRPERPAARMAERTTGVADAQREADRLVMNRYAPPGVVVNSELQILQFRGHTGPYLEPAPGEASLSLLKMAREGLGLELRAAIHKARSARAPVQASGIRLRDAGHARLVTIEVVPLQSGSEIGASGAEDRWFLVLFHEQPEAARGEAAALDPARDAGRRSARAGEESHVVKLERELSATKEYLQVTIEEQEATNEELQSTNEELLASNEELQSINEELETAREELESTNEELTTLNEELGGRNAELNRLNNDLGNLLASVNVPIVMLSSDLRIRRFTPQAERVLNLIPGDVGRPIGDIKPRIDAPDLEQLLTEVIETVSIRELEVQDREGRWYSMRIRPYRTTDNKIDGAVIVLFDIDKIRRGSQRPSGPAERD